MVQRNLRNRSHSSF